MADRYEVPTSPALAVEFRWIVGDGKQDAQQVTVSDFRRIVNHVNGTPHVQSFLEVSGPAPHTGR